MERSIAVVVVVITVGRMYHGWGSEECRRIRRQKLWHWMIGNDHLCHGTSAGIRLELRCCCCWIRSGQRDAAVWQSLH